MLEKKRRSTTNIRPLHIGKFVPPPYAGVEAHIDVLLRHLRPEAEATLLAGQSTHRDAQTSMDLPYPVIAAASYGKLASATLSPAVPWLARRELNSGRCNLLHVHAPNPWGDLAVLCCPKDIPVVMTWHSDIVRQKRIYGIYRHIQQRALARADRIIVFTPKHYESSAQLHQQDLSGRIAYVPTGIDFQELDENRADPLALSQIRSFARGRPLLLTVGRHVYYKGYEYLIAALAQLRSDAVLVMIGSGSQSPALRQQVQELGLGDRVWFLGEVEPSKLVAAYHACDIFCQPSIAPSEAFGIASAEAMACGKPTVVCELNNGVNYLNRADETSLVVPPRDIPALAAALDKLAFDGATRQRLGHQARVWVHKEFSLCAMKQGTLSVYQSLLHGENGRAQA